MNVLNNLLDERNTEGWERLQMVNGIIIMEQICNSYYMAMSATSS